MIHTEIHKALEKIADKGLAERRTLFFKTGKGEYGEGDKFLGVIVPDLRVFAKKYKDLSFDNLRLLICSPFNEERLLALLILVLRYPKGTLQEKEEIHTFYLNHLECVNNWNLVDSSAHLIMGAYLFDRNKEYLMTLAKSENMWHRRIAIISTLFFIRKKEYGWTFKLSEVLLQDSEDLIQKAVGWMLKEVGKKQVDILYVFLNENAQKMPRTMLRYATEKIPEDIRKKYLFRK